MAGALRKTMIYLGLADGDEHYEDEQSEMPEQQQLQQRPEPSRVEPERAPMAVAAEPETEYRAPVTPIKRAPSSRDEDSSLRQITTVHPRSYNDAKVIGESFRDGIPVIMNVTDMGEGDAKRLVDFSAGLVFGLHGSIERVTNKVFLLSPASVEILGEDKKSSEDTATFFNQS
ncbi:MAG: cell division protein SepF [Arthrobacter sp.]|uniref:cell division protein SepF n=1 Tax=unclassified Arthrobacter TaxID=235627 RepID=UPI0026547C3D|nr:cell division protein SepF [Micrococcaceae bacterium]MDN5812271.1 cell division protein SepF [Micrococcaceae bacterium]MDN5822865.1 cell division protein SepF [Micrococcaceae bacterium]MDN5878747.1 cell division protein SepF [Micrococcaceae bacterium]MDN5885539.1 cell division protein SepF [Micrococcaceae bacterium]